MRDSDKNSLIKALGLQLYVETDKGFDIAVAALYTLTVTLVIVTVLSVHYFLC